MAKGHKDKIAVITGAANGIGQAFAKRLAEDGVHIAIADIAPGDQTVKLVEQAGRQALACQCDVTSEQSVAAMAAQVQSKFGRCDILINCAGIYPQQVEYRYYAVIVLDTGVTLPELQGQPLHDVIHHKHPDGRHYPLAECPIDRAFPAVVRALAVDAADRLG